jgi:uncharacterized protein YvpB
VVGWASGISELHHGVSPGSNLNVRSPDAGLVCVTSAIAPDIAWRELIVSWNVSDHVCERLSVGIQPEGEDHAYLMGIWVPPWSSGVRTSVNGQKSSGGNVLTDTYQTDLAHRSVRLVLTLTSAETTGENASTLERRLRGSLSFLGLCFSGDIAAGPGSEPSKSTEGKVLSVPEKCQMSYPGGENDCSPTSLSMVLGYWAAKLGRQDLARDVPEIVKGVFDKAYDGVGNWPFNTAYVGSFPGMRAYVTRFENLNEVERWIARDVPVVCSGSLYLMQGRERPKDDPGHLVVVIGFTKEGDPIINDPGRSQVRQIYKRSNFEAAWQTSKRTVYLIHPETVPDGL